MDIEAPQQQSSLLLILFLLLLLIVGGMFALGTSFAVASTSTNVPL